MINVGLAQARPNKVKYTDHISRTCISNPLILWSTLNLGMNESDSLNSPIPLGQRISPSSWLDSSSEFPHYTIVYNQHSANAPAIRREHV